MEVCAPGTISKLPQFHTYKASNHFSFLPSKPISIVLPPQGLQCLKGSLKSTNSEQASTGTSLFVKNEPDSGIDLGDKQPSQEDKYYKSTSKQSPEDKPVGVVSLEDSLIVDRTTSGETEDGLAFEEGAPLDLQKQLAEFVEQLNQKFELEDSYSIALFGGTAATALYLASAIVGAIDSIPILPKLMEVVGLGYTVWFTSRYLLFKKNRDEFAVKIEELKQQVIGSKNK